MNRQKIAVIGLGYVGLPLAIELGKYIDTLGFDISSSRIENLRNGIDTNEEHSQDDFNQLPKLSFTDQASFLSQCDTYIVTVPTPVDIDHKPDLSSLVKASELVGTYLNAGDLVIYESTVYPGATEDDCLPILEKTSNLKVNKDFGLGYSPERINPGDNTRPISQIVKVTSGSNAKWASEVNNLYQVIIQAGTHLASSIKVAEAAKVIENTQRDLNIALINQLAQLFNTLSIDTHEVLEAASSKWNFLPFKPGLVGGHCIGVDPYYLCHKAESVGYIPDIILAGRRLNDGMGAYIASETIKLLTQHHISPHQARLLILGITFKENCSDIRNSRVIDVINELKKFNCTTDVYDPIANADEVKDSFGITLQTEIEHNVYDGVILAVSHNNFSDLIPVLHKRLKTNAVIYDLKGFYDKKAVTKRL